MNSICIEPKVLNGTVSMPPSKSAAHRAIICASLAKGVSVINNVSLSNDISATVDCMRRLGADITFNGDTLVINGSHTLSVASAVLDCGESGSTLRFLIPIAAVGGVRTTFVGHGKLPQRPIGVLTDCLPLHCTECTTQGGLPLSIQGQLHNGSFAVAGNISSQFITGLLLALPLLEGDSEIVLTSELQSSDYITMTTDAMKEFGVTVRRTAQGWHIPGGQRYQPRNFKVEGDWSQAAFFMTAASLGGCITIDNLNLNSSQGDKACLELYKAFGADITVSESGAITICRNRLNALEINAQNIPDMVPALAVTAALCTGTSVIYGAERLRIKECDRLGAMAHNLKLLGADITETQDGLIINGVPELKGGHVSGFNDHRIVMSMAAASVGCRNAVTVSDKESVNKSYPSFFEDFERLGGCCHVIMG